jgi:hypothetical protein
MLTYMASCGASSCDQFDATQAKWFKIRQVGRKDGNAEWVQQDVCMSQSYLVRSFDNNFLKITLTLVDGGVDTVTIPTNLAPGNYLIRHEIIALHLAIQRRGAEFYPACTQLRVGGSQSGKPADSELVSFPGAYSDDDPGIYDPDVYNPDVPYQFPGPKVAAFVPASTAGSSNPSNATSTRTKSTTSPTQTGLSSTPTSGPPKTSGRVCRLKKRPGTSELPRHYLRRGFHRALFSWSV